MEIMNCKNCKKIFNYISGDKICPTCKKAVEEKFAEVKAFIRENPGMNINVVAESCEVSVKQIKKWVREERLTFTDDSLVGLECERCGKMIHSGKFCAACAGSLSNSLSNVYGTRVETKQPKQSSKGKMRFLE